MRGEVVALDLRGDVLTVTCRGCLATATRTLTDGASTPEPPHRPGCRLPNARVLTPDEADARVLAFLTHAETARPC